MKNKQKNTPPQVTEASQQQNANPPEVNQSRHEGQCSICRHAQRAEIDREFVRWGNTTNIAESYGLSRDSIYRHAHATALFPKRQRNVRAALEKMIEKSCDVEVNAAAIVSAISAYARINSAGLWIERKEITDVNQLFERMTNAEMETYARDGTLPGWFTQIVGATVTDDAGGEDAS
jgi:hypothetical protein